MTSPRPHAKPTVYRREEDLVAHFARCLRRGDTPWGNVRFKFEFDYLGGYADVLALAAGGELIAFEAKLTRWREALHQAYRTRCFAHRSYVVLPTSAATLAAHHEDEFRRRRVGLCSVGADRGIEVLLEPAASAPFQPWVATRAVAEIEASRSTRVQCPLKRNTNKSQKQFVRTEA